MPEKFSYDGLFAAGVPEVVPGKTRHARYDFAVAYPNPDTLPLDGLADAVRSVLDREGRDLAYYTDPGGYLPLRELVAERLRVSRNMQVDPEGIVLTGGSGEAISMVIQALTDPGDTVLTEEFLYLGTLRSLRRYKANVVGIKCDEDGIIPEDLDATIQRLKGEGRKVKYLYTIPTFQNPLGWTMTLERRRKVLEVTRQHGVPVFEDDCYIDLRFEGEDVASFHSLDDTGQVIYVGSFSKTIAPGMRMGYLVAPPEVTSRAWAFKMGGAVNHFAALTIAEYMNNGDLEGHVREQNETLRAKRDAMLASLGENFGDAAAWTKPEGGLYVWLTLPEGADLDSIQEQAFQEGVGYYSGVLFSPEGRGHNSARLCFGYPTAEENYEGVAELARILERHRVIG